MKKLLILLVLFSNDPAEIAKTNRLKNEAEKAYNSGNYELAAQKYSMLYDSLNVTEDEIALNLAHSYYALKDSSNAKSKYQELTTSGNNKLKSIAYQQLGVMAKSPQTLKQSLAYLKSSLKADPTNEDARYDYEVVKKLLEEQQKQQQQNKDQNKDQKQDQNKQDQDKQDQQKQDQQNQDQQQKDQQNQEQKDSEKQDGEKGEQEEQDQQQNEQQKEGEQSDEEQQKNQQMSTKKKLEEMNISEEKARMILEAMRNNEVQYIQQQKRKATKSPESGKPDW